MSRREQALVLLAELSHKLRADGPLVLTRECRRYLARASEQALSDHPDPLGLARPSGDRSEPAKQLEMARAVHQFLRAGATLKRAYEEAGQIFHVTGTSDGAAAKAYRRHKGHLEEVDATYARRRGGVSGK